MRFLKNSIQWQLQIWHGAMLLLVLAAFSAVTYRAAWQDELRRVDEELSDQFSRVLASPDGRQAQIEGPPPPPRGDMKKKNGPPPPGAPFFGGGPPPPPQGGPPERVENTRAEIGRNIWALERTFRRDYFLFIDHDGAIFARSSNAPAAVPFPAGNVQPFRPTLIPGQGAAWDARSRGLYREVYRILPLGDAIVIGRHLDVEAAQLRSRAIWIAIAGLGLLTMGLAGGWWFTRRALEPIHAISRTASEIALGDLRRRIDVAQGGTELHQLAGVLNHTFAQLQAAFERQTRFTSDASHELRTPISVILSKSQTALHRDRSPEEYQEALRVCQRAAQRMRALTESLLALSRSDAGAEQIGQAHVDLAVIARETADFLADAAAEKNVALQLHLSPAPTRGDASRLAQVVTNLLTNALAHTPAGGSVEVRTHAAGNGAALIVADTGAGIAAADLPHVFDRFYRADQSRTKPGAGLGLSIVQAIVEAHGGAITAASQPGAGARFTVVLPAAADAPASGDSSQSTIATVSSL
jgi:two-component system, OmpR family, sensor kinase